MASAKIGIALGSGSARGWAHIGVLRALAERGVTPHVVAGASVGALVGATYASGQLDTLEAWVRSLRRVDVLRLLDASVRRGGMMSGDRLMDAIRDQIEDADIETLPVPFAAVATELETGIEVWLREGSMLRAVRASSGLPGLFTPIWHEGRWLIDGGVVNSVPISVCRALGAQYVIGVNLNKYLRTFPTLPKAPASASDASEPEEPGTEAMTEEGGSGGGSSRWSDLLNGFTESFSRDETSAPNVFEVIGTSIGIMQDRITRSRMVGDPPDLVLDPDLGDFDLWDFHRAAEAIEVGRRAVDELSAEVARLAAVVG